MTDAVRLLARLRSTIAEARSVPLSASVVVNRGDLLAQLDALEAALEAAADQLDAESETGTRPAVLDQHDESSDVARLAPDAEEPRNTAADAVDVIELLETARRECAELRKETDEYVDERLAQLEATLTRTLEAVSRGRGRLLERSGLGPADEPSVVPGLGFPDQPPATI